MPLKERKKRGMVRNCSKKLYYQLYHYTITGIQEHYKKKNTHTHFYKQKMGGNIFGHANLLNFATILFFVIANTLAFKQGGGGAGLREKKLDAEAKPM